MKIIILADGKYGGKYGNFVRIFGINDTLQKAGKCKLRGKYSSSTNDPSATRPVMWYIELLHKTVSRRKYPWGATGES